MTFSARPETIRRRICPAIPAELGKNCRFNAANFAGKRHKKPPSGTRNTAEVRSQENPISHWKSYVLHKRSGCRAKRVPTTRRQAGEVAAAPAYSGSLHLRFGRPIKRPPEKCRVNHGACRSAVPGVRCRCTRHEGQQIIRVIHVTLGGLRRMQRAAHLSLSCASRACRILQRQISRKKMYWLR